MEYSKNEILKQLLEKFYDRLDAHINEVNPVIKDVKLKIEYNDKISYEDMETIYETVRKLELDGWVTVKMKLAGRIEISYITLCQEAVPEIEEYLEEHAYFVSRDRRYAEVLKLLELVSAYVDSDTPVTSQFITDIKTNMKNHLGIEKIETDFRIIEMMSALEKNKASGQTISIRELSRQISSNTKSFENDVTFDSVMRLLEKTYDMSQCINNRDRLEFFGVYKNPEMFLFKGDCLVGGIYLHGIHNGLGFPSDSIGPSHVILCAKNPNSKSKVFCTVENLTAYYRMPVVKGITYLYLGGFASKEQISLIKRIYDRNPDAQYYHFGNLDAGGLRIFNNLINETGIEFKRAFMDEHLEKPEFYKNTQSLTINDTKTLHELSNIPSSAELARAILGYGRKLEHEIIALNLSTDVIQRLVDRGEENE